ncbi:MAG: DUF262 domain-containing protein [Bacteroidetes bacterium]|nr:DUF262 domain-containing protein [Bacteroidota bacterium]
MDISPDKQNIDALFSTTTFYIDFYQRQYKWNEDPVKRLLDDIFYKFNSEYKGKTHIDPGIETITAHYSWYYLNTYVSNIIGGRTFLVDGQQRFTTITLILIKLYHLCEQHKSRLKSWVERKIVGHTGYESEFWMNHGIHNQTLQSIFDDDKNVKRPSKVGGVSEENMINNYYIISKWIDNELKTKHKLETYIFYFLHRIVLINLNVEQTDVPMVFEVINDRGVRLKPYEILKGKLLGQIDKIELDSGKYNELWDNQVNAINSFNDDEIDVFFISFLRAKFANTIGESRKYDKDYHRTIFEDETNKILNLKHDPQGVKKFLKNDFKVYTELYVKLLKYYYTPEDKKFIHVFYNRLTEMDTQFLLILSCCKLNDPQQSEKIEVISYEVDRLFSLLQIQRSYNSNDFTENIFKISSEIREKDLANIRPVFDKYLLLMIGKSRGLSVSNTMTYTYFKDVGIDLSIRFKRYFFARIESFLADNLNLDMKKSVYDLVMNTGSKNGFHIEHILANNKANLKAFKNDDEEFERERNRLGGLLLLKGRDNESSGKETYKNKLKTYANSLYWNETLRKDFYKSKKDLDDFLKRSKLNIKSLDTFSAKELEYRHKLLFEMIKLIWK